MFHNNPCNHVLLHWLDRFLMVTIQLNKIRPPAARCATLKADCGCALPLVPRVKSHPLLIRIEPRNIYQNLFVKLFKSLAPGRAAGGIS